MIAFSVTDTGIGIAPENLAVIFGAFQQGDGTLSRRYGGTGLGLSISSEVSALLGGRITADSDLGRGSTFTLYVPATMPDLPPAGLPDGGVASPLLDVLAGTPGAPGAPGPAGATEAGGFGDAGSGGGPAGGPAEPDADGAGGADGAEGAGGADDPHDRAEQAGWEEINDLAGLDQLAIDLADADEFLGGAGGNAGAGLAGTDEKLASGPSGQAVATIAQRARMTGGYIAALTQATAPDEPGVAGSGTAVRNVLVFEGTSGGRLTLLAHGAVSDLGETDGTASVSTATSPAQAIAALTAEPFRCVVIDLAEPAAQEFLEQAQQGQELRDIPVLAHGAARAAGRERGRLAVLRASHQRLELLPSLDDLRERIALYLSATRPDDVPALASRPTAHQAPAPGGAPAHGTRPALAGKRVLVVDDDPRNVFAISSTLELHGMHVAHASDGRRGIEALVADPDIDLILMDIMMPGMDGYAAMTVIRQMPQFATLPIIAVTARAMESDRQKSLGAGASDYVTKPVDTDELLDCMERRLSGASSRPSH
jgi:CheY-like chemotaxis protein